MAIVRLYGDLQRYGRKFKLHVTTSQEAIRALMLQIPGFKQSLRKGHFRVRINKEDQTESTIHDSAFKPISKQSVIHIVPIVGGAKSGWATAIGGVVLMGIGIFTANPALIYAGAGLALGGAAGLLTPQPPSPSGNSTDNGPANKYVNSLANGVAQGSCVPLLYGRVMCGSKVLSQGIQTE